MTTEFTNEHHEILFALFLIEANHFFHLNIFRMWNTDELIVQYAIHNYALFWEDRAICEPEYEGWASRDAKERADDNAIGLFGVDRDESFLRPNKIIYRFEE